MFQPNGDRQRQRLKRELFSYLRSRTLKEAWRDEDVDALVGLALEAVEKIVADAQASDIQEG